MFSRRTSWDLAANALAGALEGARASGRRLLDLTESNPTRVGLSWPSELIAHALADPRASTYEPSPLGLPEARAARGRSDQRTISARSSRATPTAAVPLAA